jgi:uncharacterized protein (DUF924 family)
MTIFSKRSGHQLMASSLPTPAEVIAYWRALGPDRWYEKDDAVDAEIRARFMPFHEAAAAGKLAALENTANGTFALLLVLDQFPRNMFRGEAKAFATDPLARAVAGRAIARGFDTSFTNPERRFFYLPFMHSEVLADQERCADLCRRADDPEGMRYAEIHANIIRRFGRFPHRNTALGRTTTPEERAFLDEGGFSR